MIIVVDVDNTISDARARLRKAGKAPPKENREAYDKWLAELQPPGALIADPVVPQLRELINSIRAVESPVWILYLTSRSEKHRKDTIDWLKKHDFFPGPVFMRKDDDYRPAFQYKEAVLTDILRKHDNPDENVIFIDDDPKISRICRKYGWVHLIPVLPTARKKAIITR